MFRPDGALLVQVSYIALLCIHDRVLIFKCPFLQIPYQLRLVKKNKNLSPSGDTNFPS